MNYQRFFADALSRLKEEHRYRSCADIERTAGQFPHAVWHSPQGDRNITIWCSNDYLGMGQHPKLFTILEPMDFVAMTKTRCACIT